MQTARTTLLIVCSCWCPESAFRTWHKFPFGKHSPDNRAHPGGELLCKSYIWRHMAATCEKNRKLNEGHKHGTGQSWGPWPVCTYLCFLLSSLFSLIFLPPPSVTFEAPSFHLSGTITCEANKGGQMVMKGSELGVWRTTGRLS